MIEKITNMNSFQIKMKASRILSFMGDLAETDSFVLEVGKMVSDFTEEAQKTIPNNIPDSLAMFRKEVGDEVFNSLSSGPSFMEIVNSWKLEKGIKNIQDFSVLFKNKMAEKLTDVTDDEALAAILVGILDFA